jgi:hypothetical protein
LDPTAAVLLFCRTTGQEYCNYGRAECRRAQEVDGQVRIKWQLPDYQAYLARLQLPLGHAEPGRSGDQSDFSDRESPPHE